MKFAPNLPLMFLSLLISLALWVSVFIRQTPGEAWIPLKVHVSNVPPHLYVDRDDPNADLGGISLKFVAPEDSLSDLQNHPPDINVNLETGRVGIYRYPATLSPRGAEKYLASTSPTTIQVKLEPIIERASVPIEVERTGSLQDPTLAVDGLNPTPASATIKGPQSVVESVVKCQAFFDLSKVTPDDTTPRTLTLQPVNSQGQDLGSKDLTVVPQVATVTAILTARPQSQTAFVNPVFVGQVATGYETDSYEVDPPSVVISGNPTLLAKVTTISTEPIDVNGLAADRVFRVRLRVPFHIQLRTRLSYVTVRYHVRPNPSYHAGSGAPSNPSNDFPSTVPPLSGSRRGGN
jgi:hypothetical protein